MCTPPQLDRDLFRILLYRKGASELLLESTPNGFRLPVVTIPAHTRIAQELTTEIRQLWNFDMYCLFELPVADATGAPVQAEVAEAWEPDASAPEGKHWMPLASFATEVFADTDEYALVKRSLATLEDYRFGRLPGAFGKPGFLREVTEWVHAQAATSGVKLTGKFCQLNACPTFSLIRFETNGPALWFKAVGEPNLHEFSVTLKLAQLFPDFLPRILGSCPEWNAWLAVEFDGNLLDRSRGVRRWIAAAKSLARLQIASFGRSFELIGAGCKDLRPCRLKDLLGPFFDVMSELMPQQTSRRVNPLSREELLSVRRRVSSALDATEDSQIPSTLGHLDFNPGNILVSDGRTTFLDWAEGCIAHPFFTFQYLLEYWRRRHGKTSLAERMIVSAYVSSWQSMVVPEEVAMGLVLAPLLSLFAYASSLGWRGPELLRLPYFGCYLRSLVRRMKREADLISERRILCAR